MVYIYESHMGGLYDTHDIQEDTYCEQCGDRDWLKGTAECKEDVYKLFEGEIDDGEGSGGWDREYIEEFVDNIEFG